MESSVTEPVLLLAIRFGRVRTNQVASRVVPFFFEGDVREIGFGPCRREVVGKKLLFCRYAST